MLGAGPDLDWYGYLVGMEYQNTFGASSETQSVSMKPASASGSTAV